MPSADWSAPDWVSAHESSREEIAGLLSVADRDLRQCRAPGLEPDWRLSIAYNAALQCATAALAAAGYRAKREGHHYHVIQSLSLTLGWPAAKIKILNRFRRQRHLAGYERAGVVSPQNADDMVKLAQELRQEVEQWLLANHPELWAATS